MKIHHYGNDYAFQRKKTLSAEPAPQPEVQKEDVKDDNNRISGGGSECLGNAPQGETTYQGEGEKETQNEETPKAETKKKKRISVEEAPVLSQEETDSI